MDMRLTRAFHPRHKKTVPPHVRLELKAQRARVYVARDGRGRVIGAR